MRGPRRELQGPETAGLFLYDRPPRKKWVGGGFFRARYEARSKWRDRPDVTKAALNKRRASTRRKKTPHIPEIELCLVKGCQQGQTAASGRILPMLLHQQVAYQCLFRVADPRHGKHPPRAPGSKNMPASGRLTQETTDYQEPLCILFLVSFCLCCC